MMFYAPCSLKEHTQSIVPLYFSFSLLVAVEYTGGICDFYEFLEVLIET